MITPQRLMLAKRVLHTQGYELIMTLMSGDTGSKNYGLLFFNGDEERWLNKDTIETILLSGAHDHAL